MRNAALFFILIANILAGLSYLWQKQALEGLPPATISVLRNVVAIACMAIWLAARRRFRWRYRPREYARLLVAGVLGFGGPLLLGSIGIRRSSVGNASVLILIEPAAILVLSWLLLKERISRRQGAGVILGLAGALLVVIEDAPLGDLFSGAHLQGNLILALHALLWGLYTPIMKPLAVEHDPLDLTFLTMLLAMIVLVPAALLEAGEWQRGPALPRALGLSIWLGVLVSFGSTLLWNHSLKHLRASTVAAFIFIQPLTGLLSGYWVLGETPTPFGITGALLIAGGVLLVAYRRRGRAR